MHETDEALMERFCRGEEAAFEALYARYADPVFGFLRQLVGDRNLAEDLLQTTFLSFVRARDRYQSTSGVRGWLYAIAANAGRDALRRRRARPEYLSATGVMPDSAQEPAALPDPPLARALELALGRVPPEQREAVLLHKLHGFSFPEIAETLGISQTAAKVRAHRGYEKLRTFLTAFEGAT